MSGILGKKIGMTQIFEDGKYWISTVLSSFVIGLASWINCVLEQATKANNINTNKKIFFIKIPPKICNKIINYYYNNTIY